MTKTISTKVILSPEDAATHARWRLAVMAIYAGLVSILAATWGVHHLANPAGGIPIAASLELTGLSDAVRGWP